MLRFLNVFDLFVFFFKWTRTVYNIVKEKENKGYNTYGHS